MSWQTVIQTHRYAYLAASGALIATIMKLVGGMSWWAAVFYWVFWTGLMWLFFWWVAYNNRRRDSGEHDA